MAILPTLTELLPIVKTLLIVTELMPMWTPLLSIYHTSIMSRQLYHANNVNGWQLAKMKKSIPDMSLP